MPRVTLKFKDEPFEKMLNRWKRAVDKSDILNDYYRKEFYEKKSEKRTRARAAAIKREQRRQAEANQNRPMV